MYNSWPGMPATWFFQLDANYWVPDTVFVDGDLLLDHKNRQRFLDHEIRGSWPGVVQTLMFAFLAKKPKNLFLRSKVIGIRNDRSEDIALMALYLASPASSWVTGKIFEVDGGTEATNWPFEYPEV